MLSTDFCNLRETCSPKKDLMHRFQRFSFALDKEKNLWRDSLSKCKMQMKHQSTAIACKIP